MNAEGEEGVPDIFDDTKGDYDEEDNQQEEEEEDLRSMRTRSKRVAVRRGYSYSEQSLGIRKAKKKGGKRKRHY